MSNQLPPSVDKLRLPRLTRNEAQARTALAQRARACSFQWGEQAWQLSLVPLVESGPPPAQAGSWRVQAQWAGAPFELMLPSQAVQAWVAARFPELDLGALPDELAAAALEAACQELLGALAALKRGPAQVLGLVRGGTADDGLPQLFELEARCGEQLVPARLATNSLGLMLMAGLVARMPPLRNELPAQDLPLTLCAEIGYSWLSAGDVAGLSAGDAVFVEHPFITSEGELWLGRDGWGVRVRWADTQLTVTQAFSQLELTMSSTTPAAGGDQPTPPDQLPLRLAFDLGERSITLGELQSLQVGQSLELAQPLSSAVSLRVNGALVGRGELVEIDGRLGVTITALASR